MRPARRVGRVWAESCAPAAKSCAGWMYVRRCGELELELIQSHMAQKPMLRGEVGARALRVRSVSREYDLGSPPRACDKPFEIDLARDAVARYLLQRSPALQN